MSKILVCGLTNVETTVAVDSFPLLYQPIDYNFFGIDSAPSGVALNISLALSTLSTDVTLLSMVGTDTMGNSIMSMLKSNDINTDYLMRTDCSAQSVVLYDKHGRRRIFCDLKDFQDNAYDEKLFTKAASDCDILCLCNINFSRNLLSIAKSIGKTIATDVHTLSDINDEYNRDFMSYADILFLSNENIVDKERDFVLSLAQQYGCKLIVVGMGDKGALLYSTDDKTFYHACAKHTRDVVNTVGAGDALFSSFLHFYSNGYSAEESLEYATYFASYKIGESGGTKGFISQKELLKLIG